jgi:hypothetical protein
MSRSDSWRRRLRSVEAAAVAGLVHAILLSVALMLVLTPRPALDAADAEITASYSTESARYGLLTALNLAPLSVIALLWFIAVIRRRVGDREDKLFASVFLGSGLLFAGLLLIGFAVITAPAVVFETTGRAPDPDIVRMLWAVGRGTLNSEAPRLAAVFVLATSSLGRRSGAFPRWLVLLGLVFGLIMIANTTISDPIPWLFPVWVAVASITLLLRREAAHRDLGGSPKPGTTPRSPG